MGGESTPLSAIVAFDLTGDDESQGALIDNRTSAEALPLLPREARWDLARRCRALAGKLAAPASSRGWQKQVRECPAAQEKAAGTDDGGRWLPALVLRLLDEHARSTGQ